MKLHLSLQVATIGLCFSLLANGEAKAANFNFTKIADTNDDFISFGTPNISIENPAINNKGTVSFKANLDTGSQGIFTGNGSTITTIVDTTSGSLNDFGSTSINNAGTVAFTAYQTTQNPQTIGIYTGNGKTTNPIITTPTSGSNGEPIGRTNSFSQPSINNSGTVAFREDIASRVSRILTSNGKTTTNLTDNLIPTLISLQINDAGTVAYSNFSGAFTSNGTTTTIAESNYNEGIFINNVSINNQGTVAYTSVKADVEKNLLLGGSLLTSKGTKKTTIADLSGDFSNFGSTSINDAGTVAFLANLDAGGEGIFLGSNSVNDKVIATGDQLSGATVTSLGFASEGLNNSGEVAFYAQLSDGKSGIYRADSVPESTSVLGVLVFGAFGAAMKYQRKIRKVMQR